MIRYAQLWAFSAALWTCCAAAKLDPAMREARMIRDIAELRFDLGAPPAPWVLLKISPSQRSGAATIPGTAIDGTTGKNVPREKAPSQIAILEEGSWSIVEALDPYRGPAQGAYSWMEPPRTHDRDPAPDSVYNPFSSGGLVLCRLDPDSHSQAAFQAPFLIPPAWAIQVRAAYQQFKKTNPKASDGYANPASASNGLLAIVAFRAVLARGGLPSVRIRQAFAGSNDYLRSALIYLLVTSHAAGIEAALQSDLEQVVKESSARQLEALALGVFTARLFHPELFSDRLTQSLTAGLLQASAHTPAADRVRTLLRN